MLLAALIGYRRRSLRSSIVLIGVLGWLLYCYASTSLYTAYNRLFGLYVVALGLALFAVPLALRSIDPVRFAADFPARPSPRVLVGYLACLAGLLSVARAPALLSAAITGGTPTRPDAYSTEVTWAGPRCRRPRRRRHGMATARRISVGPVGGDCDPVAQRRARHRARRPGSGSTRGGVPVEAGEIAGKMASFMVMTAVAASLLLPLLRRLVPGSAPARRSGPA